MIENIVKSNAIASWLECKGRASRLAVVMAVAFVFILLSPAAQSNELRETFNAHDKHGEKSFDHMAWNTLLGRYLHAGNDGLNRLDYAGLKKSGRPALNAYVQSLEAVNPSALTVAEQFSFWTNLYNAKTAQIVISHYPVASIRDIKLSLNPFAGPWRAKVVKVQGHELSLDDIEHKILRPVWNDPRIHYAVNCASVGCPNLAMKAYTGRNLETMLDVAARDYINSPRGVEFDNGRIIVSSLYDWYGSDFGDGQREILAHIARYAEPPLAKRLKNVSDFDDFAYDWMLNDKK